MGVTAFNASEYPQVWPFEGFTLKWFAALVGDDDITYGLRNSLLIGVLVVALSVPVGLAGAILMTQVYRRARAFYYLVVVSPVLTPGVIIGISDRTRVVSGKGVSVRVDIVGRRILKTKK